MAKTKETTKKTAVKKPITAAKKKTCVEKKPVEKNAAPNDTGEKPSNLWTTDEVAKYSGLTTARISQLKRDGVITPAISGSRKEGDLYKPLETFIKLTRHYRELSDSRGSRETEEMKKARERQMIAKARKEELELSGVEGELVKTDEIERVIGAALSRLRINLLAIPKGVAPQIRDLKDTNVIAEKIYERICRAMNEVVNLNVNELLAEE